MAESPTSNPSFIKVVHCYMDETGLLNAPRDKFFAVGMIKVYRPEELYLAVKVLRDKLQYYDELKWSGIYNKNAPVVKRFMDLFFDYRKARFSCYIFKKNDLDLTSHFKGDLFEAYQAFAAMQLSANINRDEHAILSMDDMSTPARVKMEQTVKNRVNAKSKRQAVLGVTRVYSKGVELVQMTDLLLGAVIYDWKIKESLVVGPGIPKRDVLNHALRRAGVKTFYGDIRTSNMDIWQFKAK